MILKNIKATRPCFALLWLKHILAGWKSLKSEPKDAGAKLIMKSINREIRTQQFYESGGKQHERKKS